MISDDIIHHVIMKLKTILVFLLNLLLIAPVVNAQTTCDLCDSTLLVTGQGEVTAKPDQSTIVVQATSRGKTAGEAVSTNASQMQKLINALTATGILASDIQTQNVSVFPIYKDKINPQNATNNIIAYEATNSVIVIVKKVDDTGRIIDLISSTGDYIISGINFTLENDENEKADALDEAVADARQKAEAIASAARTKITGIKKISADSGYISSKGFDAGAAPSSTPVQPGDLTVNASVSIEYIIEK